MIKIIDGDLFTSNARIIAHQVNCQKRMASGVALQVKNKYPNVYDEYLKACSEDMLGKIQIVPVNSKWNEYDCGSIAIPHSEKFVCNMFAQKDYGYDGELYTDINALAECFTKLNWLVHEKNNNYNSTIAMPYKVGCCRGGADWNEVYKMIDNIFKYQNVELWRLDNG